MRVHPLKTWPEFFAAMWDGRKRFEVRRDDRSFAVGDCLHLVEWDPTVVDALTGRRVGETGRVLRAIISYKLPGGRFGIAEDMCVLGFTEATPIK